MRILFSNFLMVVIKLEYWLRARSKCQPPSRLIVSHVPKLTMKEKWQRNRIHQYSMRIKNIDFGNFVCLLSYVFDWKLSRNVETNSFYPERIEILGISFEIQTFDKCLTAHSSQSSRNKDICGTEQRWGEIAKQNKCDDGNLWTSLVSCRVKYRIEYWNNDNEFLLMLIEFDVRRKRHAIIAMKLKV